MRWPLPLTALSLALASCGGDERSSEDAAANADLFSPETVDALLGAEMPTEETAPTNDVSDNSAAADDAGGPENEASDEEGTR
jgi:hypothetical protein